MILLYNKDVLFEPPLAKCIPLRTPYLKWSLLLSQQRNFKIVLPLGRTPSANTAAS